MSEARARARSGWGTAVALLIVVTILSVFHAFPLVALPLAILLLAIPSPRRARQRLGGTLIVALTFLFVPADGLAAVSRGWGLLLGSALLAASLARPAWGVFPRAFAALAIGLALSGAWLAATGQWAEVDGMMRQHYASISNLAAGDLAARMPDSAWAAEFRAATERVARTQWTLFPALLGLQSLAALALAAWWMDRFQLASASGFALRSLREFRFHDQLVWVLAAGLLLVALPVGPPATRVGYNMLFFMGGLYALRGVGILLFLVGRAPSFVSIVIGTVAALFLYPLFLATILLVGLGDTWLDVRARAAVAPRA